MVATDLELYWRLYRPTTDRVRAGIRLMLWSQYVKSRVGKLNAAEEMALLSEDEKTMGGSGWWR